MDKRSSRLNQEVGNKSTNGQDKVKEAALDKLRQMEWMRNKQDPWHLARSNSKKNEGYSKKNNNKDEESYFEGTGNQKSKKNRKPRQPEVSTTVQTGFSMAVGPSTPPAVNAWTQKKGSALFTKQSEEVDEEDEMLKLALKESIKTAEEDKIRHLERMRMMNLEVLPTLKTELPVEKQWDREECYYSQVEEKYSPNPPSTNRDLEFIDTDDTSPPSQRRRPPLPRTRTLSKEKVSVSNKNNVESSHSHTNTTSALKLPKDSFESSHRNDELPAVRETGYGQTKQSLLTDAVAPRIDGNEKMENNITLETDLSLDFTSKLTFGNTQEIPESNYDSYNHVSHNLPNHFSYNTQNYEPIDRKHSVPISVPKPVLSGGPSNLSDNVDDTDKILHSFIRHDPPSFTQKPTEMFGSNTNQHFLLPNSFEQNQHIINGLVSDNPQLGLQNYSVRDTMSPETSLSFQNVSPSGSVGKETMPGLPENAHQMTHHSSHFHFPYAMNNQEASNNLQALQMAANSNIPSQITFPSAPPGYTLLQQSVRAVPPVMNQYGFNNTNAMVPNTHTMVPNTNTMTHNTNSMLPNTMMPMDVRNLLPQQYHQSVAMNAYDPYQQANLFSPNISQKEQTNIPNQSQMSPNENQSPIIPTQNPMQILQQYQLQMMSALNQYQINMVRENSVQKPVEFPLENKEQMTEQGLQQQSSVKTRDELQQEYLQAMQYINHLQQQLANTAQQTLANTAQQTLANTAQQTLANTAQQTLANMAQQTLANTAQQTLANTAQQTQGQSLPYNYPPTSLPHPITNNMFHPGMQMMSIPQQSLPQVPASTGQISPIIPASLPNMQTTSDPVVGRGRGRLQ